jgi:hypothetical protein
MFDFVAFAIVGFLAQLIDGALGMGYGVICSILLLATGVPPVQTSASVHAAKLFTSGTAGTSHWLNGNVDRKLMIQLAVAGVIGGICGALLLTHVSSAIIRPFIFAYLLIVGILILVRVFWPAAETLPRGRFVALVGATGGFLDALEGGGWGPVVTSTLIGSGAPPRYVIGSVNAAEFLVTSAVLTIFLASFYFGISEQSQGMLDNAMSIAALIAGGIPAALLSGVLLKKAPRKPLTIAVSLLIIAISAFELVNWFAEFV